MKLIIAISGKAGHGKDSLAKILRDELSKTVNKAYFVNVSYADKLKDVASDLYDLDREELNNLDYKMWPIPHFGDITPRKILQVLGTDIARNLFGNIWVYHYEKAIANIILSQDFYNIDNFVIFTPDMRFINEYEAQRKYNMYGFKTCMIRVYRPGFEINTGSTHSSENGLDDVIEWDYYVEAKDMDCLNEMGRTVAKLITIKYF